MKKLLALLLLCSPASARNSESQPLTTGALATFGRAVPGPTTAWAQAATANSKVVNADAFAGADVGAKIAAADTVLGSGRGLIQVSTAGALSTPFTLHTRHNLVLNARITVSATVTLSGSNDVTCSGAGAISSTLAGGVPVFAGDGVSDIAIHHCPIAMKNNSPVIAAAGLSRLSMRYLTVTGGSIAQINANHGGDPGGAATNLDFNHNTVTDPAITGGAALLLVNTTGVTVDSNTFTGISTGTQWWGGDSATGNITQVTRTGKIALTGNQCHNVTACLWGSMGHDIEVKGNTADGCADVCFDTEGGLRNAFTQNKATNCGNGCGAIFFFSKDISFVENSFGADAKGGGLFFIKNQSANPISHTGLTVSRNTLTCTTTCTAFYQEAVSQATFEANVITNGIFAPVGFGQNVTIARNQFSFTRPVAPNAAAIAGPSITGGATLTIEGNTVASAVPQAPGSACISAVWNDFNNSDTYLIKNNRCTGSSPFPIDIVTTTAGANPGPHASWHLENNFTARGNIVHTRITTNDVYTLNHNCTPSGCSPE